MLRTDHADEVALVYGCLASGAIPEKGTGMKGRGSIAFAVAVAMVLTSPLSVAATVSGRNGRVAFRRFLDKEQTRAAIFTIRPDGSGDRQLTHPPRGVLHLTPDWA